MNEYIITCCSTADMPKEFFKEKNIPYACFHFNMEGVDYKDDLGETMPFGEFYQKIRAGAMPTTSQVNVKEFIELFEPYLKEEKDILHLSFSSGLSGVYNSVCIAREELLEKYPKRKIMVMDSLGASSGYGMLIDKAVMMRDNGASINETYTWLEAHKLNIHHWFFTTDLTHYLRGGRITVSSAFFGTILGICPLLNMSFDGKLKPRKKIRGKKHVIDELIKMMEEHAEAGTNYNGKCFISHSDCYEDARKVADLVERKFPKLHGKVLINSVGTVIGAHTGPGTVALFFWGDKRID